MIKVTIKNIIDYGLPLDDDRKVMTRGCSEEILKELERKYSCSTNDVCKKVRNEFVIYNDVRYNNIPDCDKDLWVVNFEVYIRSSSTYKFYIMKRRINRKFR